MSRFRKLLREARKCAGLSQPKLAKKVDVDKSYISKLETGVFPPPSREVVLKLTAALNIREKTRRWLEFLLAAGVASEEDMEGFELVKLSLGQTGGQEQESQLVSSEEEGEGEAVESKQKASATPLSILARAAKAIPDVLFGTTGEEIDYLIDTAGLSELEEMQVDNEVTEFTKRLLTLIKTLRQRVED